MGCRRRTHARHCACSSFGSREGHEESVSIWFQIRLSMTQKSQGETSGKGTTAIRSLEPSEVRPFLAACPHRQCRCGYSRLASRWVVRTIATIDPADRATAASPQSDRRLGDLVDGETDDDDCDPRESVKALFLQYHR